MTLVQTALLLALNRREARAPDLPPLPPIRSLAYFLPIIEELRLNPPEPGYLTYFAPDVPMRERKALYATQGAGFIGTLDAKATVAAWRVKPSRYVLAKKDQMIAPAMQEFMSARMGAKVTSAPALSGGDLVVGDYNGRVWALSARTGAVRWVGSAPGRVYASRGPLR